MKNPILGIAPWIVASCSATLALHLPCHAQQVQWSEQQLAALQALRDAPNDLASVSALDLPDAFLRHVLDWELRNAWREANHRIESTTDAPARATAPPTTEMGPQPQPLSRPTVLDAHPLQIEPRVMDVWRTFAFEVPQLRGFRAPLGPLADDPWPFALLSRETDAQQAQRYRKAAEFVATNLARDGLIRTILRLMNEVDAPARWLGSDGALKLNRLRAVGVPVDLLDMFTIDGRSAKEFLAAWISGGKAENIDSIASRSTLAFQPSCAGFTVMPEDGSGAMGSLRLQLPTNRFREGRDDGSVLDVFRQIALRDSSVPIIVSIHADAVDSLLNEMAGWSVPQPGRIVIAPQPANVTQWAQDNARAGQAAPARTGQPPRTVLLAPRFASRTELRSVCVPSDSLVMETLQGGFGGSLDVVQSPLLFQGGNTMLVVDPKSSRRILLIGEAEIYRNRALGLSQSQVIAAFKIEFGADACEIIPAASFHIDQDFTIRRCGSELVACFADDVAAARLIAAEGARALARNGAILTSEVDAMVQAISSGGQRASAAAGALNRALDGFRQPDRSISPRLAAMLSTGDSAIERAAAVDGARRLLVAVDIFTAASISDAQLSNNQWPPAHRDYLQSIRAFHARLDDQANLLKRLGMRIERAPAISDRRVSANPVNGLQLSDRYLMPACGGLAAAVDEAARETFERAFGSATRIEPIHTSAVQTTDGGLHCLIAILPR